MPTTLEGSNVINIADLKVVDSKVSKEENYKNRMVSAVRSLKAQLLRQLVNQQFLNAKQLEELELELERQALIHKNEEDLQRWLQNEIDQMQRNFEAMQALQSKPSVAAQVEQIHQEIRDLSQKVAALRAEFTQAQQDVIDPAIVAIGIALSNVEASLALPVSVLPEEEMLALCDEVKRIDLEVDKARGVVDGWFKRFVEAKKEADPLVTLIQTTQNDLENDEIFVLELEPLHENLAEFRKTLNLEDIFASLESYQQKLDDLELRNTKAQVHIGSRVEHAPERYSSLVGNLNSFFKPKPSFGRKKSDEELSKLISGYASKGFSRSFSN